MASLRFTSQNSIRFLKNNLNRKSHWQAPKVLKCYYSVFAYQTQQKYAIKDNCFDFMCCSLADYWSHCSPVCRTRSVSTPPTSLRLRPWSASSSVIRPTPRSSLVILAPVQARPKQGNWFEHRYQTFILSSLLPMCHAC